MQTALTGRAEAPRAVIACLDERRTAELASLLTDAGFEPSAIARDADNALEAIRLHRPALILTDAVLPGLDGIGLARRVLEEALSRYPFTIILCPEGLALPGRENLSDLGAAALAEPFRAEDLRSAYEALSARSHALPEGRAIRLDRLLDALGIPEHPGREMLKCAAALAWRDSDRLSNLRDRIYPDAARPLGRTAAQAERAIRHVIEAAWRTGEIERQNRIFGNTIDARRGRPTCGEMIAQLADILRWEGRP